MAILERDNRYVYYLITKKRVYDKPTYQSLRSSVEAMLEHVTAHDVKRISMPRIGCGLDGLNWSHVSTMLRDVFVNSDVEITVYSLK